MCSSRAFKVNKFCLKLIGVDRKKMEILNVFKHNVKEQRIKRLLSLFYAKAHLVLCTQCRVIYKTKMPHTTPIKYFVIFLCDSDFLEALFCEAFHCCNILPNQPYIIIILSIVCFIYMIIFVVRFNLLLLWCTSKYDE